MRAYPDRCCCSACLGLAEFMAEETGKDYGLPASPGHAPTLLEAIQGERCTGEMTCPCSACDLQRQQRKLVRPVQFPWETAA